MKTTTQHTTTPWKQNGAYFDANGRLVGKAIQMKGKTLQDDEAEEMLAKANAAFIVRAVNSHEALLESLKYLHEEYIHTHKIGAPPKIGCHECEVIAQAEGKGE